MTWLKLAFFVDFNDGSKQAYTILSKSVIALIFRIFH